MIEGPLLLVAGLLGSAHCLGMCGPFALALGSAARTAKNNVQLQLAYSAGRISTYVALGALAGFGGEQLARRTPAWLNVPAVLGLAAGGYLIYQGLLAAGWLKSRASSAVGCPSGRALRMLLSSRSRRDALAAGVFTALIPCGLLYGMLALAATTHHALAGGASLAWFALGTLPAMLLAGSAGTLLSVTFRRRVFAVAAWCLVLTGVITAVRGASHLELPGRSAPGCPMCQPAESAPPSLLRER